MNSTNIKKNIFCIFGPSGSGKDSITREVLKKIPELTFMIPITTRPKRANEEYGKNYFFITREKMEMMIDNNQFLEHRKYDVLVDGKPDVWYYATEIPNSVNSVIIGTPDVVKSLEKFAKDNDNYNIYPIYISVDEKELLLRMIKREDLNENHNWEEVIRRFYADKKDFEGIGTINNSCKVSFIVENSDGLFDKSVSLIVEFIKSKIF